MVKIDDPVGDLFARIKNAALAKKREFSLPFSKLRLSMLEVLKKEGYLSQVKKEKDKIMVELAYKHRAPLISGVRNISRPGVRIYRKASQLPRPLGGAGISIVSTSQGIMSNKDAQKKKLGGEVLGEVW